ncbi:2-methylcitrate dehydratase PrpD [Beijerinckia sp. 28-YEA-48]|nr:2-methylcitrate dehydratase PrpD [Beijerinckia sp. 28-YEA-48]
MTRFTITQELIAIGEGVYKARLPSDVIELAKLSLLDFIGVAISGSADPSIESLVDRLLPDGSGVCSIIGHSVGASLEQAVLINATAGHVLDYDDVHMALPGHLSAVIWPAIIAVAQHRCISPEKLISAYVAGFEVGCRIGILVAPGHYDRGYHASATIGTFATTIAVCQLLGLSSDQTASALGISSMCASGFKAQFGTMGKAFQVGLASRNGMSAAIFSEAGAVSCSDIFGDPRGFCRSTSSNFNAEAALSQIPGTFKLRSNLFKFHASCYGTHAAIECALKLLRGGIDTSSIRKVVVRIGAVNETICNIQNPTTAAEAKFSVRLLVSYALNQIDTARLDVFDLRQIVAPEVQSLLEIIVVEIVDGYTLTQASVRVCLEGGIEHSAESDVSDPYQDYALLGSRLLSKFQALVIPCLGTKAAGELVNVVESFQNHKSLSALGQAMQSPLHTLRN